MPTEASVRIQPDQLAQIVESVFANMLGLEVHVCEAPWFAGRDRLTAGVYFTGSWSGVLVLECDDRQACRFAGQFLSADPPAAVNDVVRDMLGELINMIGGNLKSVLSRGIKLSLPSVADSTGYGLRVCGAEVAERLAFRCGEDFFWITICSCESASGCGS